MGTKETIPHSICLSNKGLCPGEQKRAIHTPREDVASFHEDSYDTVQYDGMSSRVHSMIA